MKRLAMLIVLILLVPSVLAACGGDDLSAEDAEKALKAAFEGDRDTANEYLCDAEQIGEDEVAALEGVTVSDIDCDIDGDTAACEVTLSIAVEGADPIEQTTTINAGIEDGKLCGGDIAQ